MRIPNFKGGPQGLQFSLAAAAIALLPYTFAADAGQNPDLAAVIEKAKQADIVLLGEVHDNPAHHLVQAEVNAAIVRLLWSGNADAGTGGAVGPRVSSPAHWAVLAAEVAGRSFLCQPIFVAFPKLGIETAMRVRGAQRGKGGVCGQKRSPLWVRHGFVRRRAIRT